MWVHVATSYIIIHGAQMSAHSLGAQNLHLKPHPIAQIIYPHSGSGNTLFGIAKVVNFRDRQILRVRDFSGPRSISLVPRIYDSHTP